MATYKVIQDIEAEDKFIGPLTLKQFIFAMGGAFFSYLCIFAMSRGATWALAIFLPPAFFGFFMAFPWSKDQPTDVWVLAKIRFRIKPKKRVWDQDGVQELVTITAPKKVEKILTKDITQKEVKSHLKALADTIDSRGWAVKNASFPTTLNDYSANNDRLVDPSTMPQQVPDVDVDSIPDMLDDSGLDGMIEQRDQIHKAQLLDKMERIRAGEPLESINQPEVTINPPSEHLLAEKLRAKKAVSNVATRRMHTVSAQNPQPFAPQPVPRTQTKHTSTQQDDTSVTESTSADIIKPARNNHLSVATIQKEANDDKSNTGEVVISLH